MDSLLFAGTVEKYSMGRGTGLRAKNWKPRTMKLTRSTLALFEKAASPTPKFQCPLSAISVVFCNPTASEHPMAGHANDIDVRLFDNGVFDMLVRAESAEEKAKWLAAFKEGLAREKGFQFIE